MNDGTAFIDRVTARLVEVPLGEARGGSGATHLQLVHVTVRTNDGAEGTGFTYSLGGGAESIIAILNAVHIPAVKGLSVMDWDRTWYEIRDQTRRLGRGVVQLATSALDIAVWDLRARLGNLPLHRLLGSHRDEVPIYGSGRFTNAMTTEQLVENAAAYVGEGYTAIKLRAGLHSPTTDVRRIETVRGLLDSDCIIMVDCNERLDLSSAIWLSRQLATIGVYWLEEPLPSDNIAGYRALAANSPVPLAIGEHLQGLSEFASFARPDVCGILQPDAPITGGVSEFMRIATLAEANGLAISPHFLPELHVHLAAATRTTTWIEHFPLIDELLGETLSAKDGHVEVPDRAGHGMIWNYDALQRFTVAQLDSAVRQA